MKILCVAAAAVCLTAFEACAQTPDTEELIRYGDMEHWVIREVKESGIIGGNVKTLYELGPNKTVSGRAPYVNEGGSQWATSNVLAKVSGIYKTNVSVFKDSLPNGSGYCAKLLTHIEKVKVLGVVNISVIAAGSLALGNMNELITGTKDGNKYLNYGIPFTKRPKALRFDYKIHNPGNANRLKMTGFSGKKSVAGADSAIVVLLLQKRAEDAEGNITAQRIGTLVVKYGKSTGWIKNATYSIFYGDASGQPGFDPTLMGLRNTDYALNSKGESVIINETGWAPADTTPTHICLQFASSHGGAYIGTPGNAFWVDNVRLVY